MILGGNFYFIKVLNYFIMEELVVSVCICCYERLNEKEYVLVYNNCEYVILYIMIGIFNLE